MLAQRPPCSPDSDNSQLIGSILCVDDESQILTSLKRLFRREGHTIILVTSGAEALAYLQENPVDIVISDMRMPEMDGNQFLSKIAIERPETVRILLTGYSDMESTIGAINNGSIYRYIAKPWDDTDLLMTVQGALETKFLRDERTRLTTALQSQNEDLQQLNNSLEDKAKARTRDLRIAARVQIGLLSPSLNLPAISAHGVFRPAEFIAGDGYDFFALEDNLFAFYVFDVEGHGTSAAMVSFAVQIHLNPKVQGICQQSINEAESLEDAVTNTLYMLNKSFYVEDGQSPYFTMIYGIIDLSTGLVTFGQAGHPAPLLYSSHENTISEHGNGGNPIAMFCDPVFGISRCQMLSGDRLVIYSDGATECTSGDGKQFGTDRLASKIIESAPLKIAKASTHIADSLITWHTSEIFDDDLTVLQLEYRGF